MAEIEGLKELDRKLKKLGDSLAAGTLRKAGSKALQKTFRDVKAAAPVGSKPHKTYRGRLVTPGYLKRSLKKSSRAYKNERKAVIKIKASPEAFYGIQFIDRGTKHIKARRWFADKYSKNKAQVQDTFADELKKEIGKIL